MKLEYEGVFFIGWVIRFVIFQQVSDYRFKRIYLFTIPIIFTFVEYFFYDVVFWCEFFFLPIIVLFIKTKKNWSLIQSLFYCFFTLTIFEIVSSLSSLYFQFVFRISEVTLNNNVWLDWIPTLLSFPLYVLFLKLVRIDLNTFSREIKNDKLTRVVYLFTITMILYYISSYILRSIPTLEYAGWISFNIEDIYINRVIIYSYFPIFLGFLLYIQYLVKENINRELEKIKDSQISSMSIYSKHIESLYKEIKSFRHDYTNILVSLNESIKNRDIDGIESIYNSVLLDSDKTFYNTHYDIANLVNLENLAMKSIISAKMFEAQSKQIRLSIEIEKVIKAPSGIDLIELLKILAIFLDNAIEASLESSAPEISFVYFQEENRKIMIIENSTKQEKINTKVIFNYGYSTKGSSRGVGLANVYEIISTYSRVYLKTYSNQYKFRQELVFEDKKE
jgi:two-component system sensor histidine kinase AgrC